MKRDPNQKRVFQLGIDSGRDQCFAREKRVQSDPDAFDVAVMRDGPGDEQPVCAIEIKRLNPSDKFVREDLERNAAYFSLRNQIDDRPLIEFAAFAALHRYRPGYRTQDLEKARRLYERRAGKIALPTGVCRTVQVFQVDKLEEPVYNFEVEEVDQEAYMLMGIVVVFHWAEHGDDEPSRQPIGEVA